jgi:hypothetical protein
MTAKEFQVATGLMTETCCQCGMLFAVPSDFQNRRRVDHSTFYCPSGHSQAYLAKSHIEIAKEERDRAVKEADRLKSCVAHKKGVIRIKEYQVRHYKGEVTKLRKKVTP